MIIGITGTDGAGKGTVVRYLVEEKGFTHYSARDFLVTEIKKRGLPMSRNQMRLMGNEFREKFGNDFIVSRAYDLIKKDAVDRAVIESLRAVGEAEFLKEQGGILLAVDASKEVRFKRVQARRSESDKVTFEDFIRYEEIEKNDHLPNGLNKAAVMEMADYTIYNNGSMDELRKEVEIFCDSYAI